ncbi:MAG: hypothetical protein IJ715_04595 [Bacilli bacterium]|nr:hypothetical protein [Bacilli bacterium]
MKKKNIIIVMMFLFALVFNIIKADNSNLPLFGKVIYIDPGHGEYLYTRSNIIEVR